MELILPILLFFALLILGMPIAFSLAISGIGGLLLTFGWGPTLGMIQTVPFRQTASYTLTTVGMFILMAELATQSGITSRLFELANRMVGHLRGGLAIATVVACAAFGAISGSSVAATATMSRIAIPEMLERGYSRLLAAGVVSTAGTIAIMIPPSIPLIIYGIVTETSIRMLLLAGILPGILTGILYSLTIAVWARVRPQDAPQFMERSSWSLRWEVMKPTWPFLVVALVILLGIYTGAITPTEAGAVGALVTGIIWVLLSRFSGKEFRLTGERFGTALDRTLRSTTMIIVMIVGAYFFGYFLTSTGVTQQFTSYVASLPFDRMTILAILIVMYIILGCFLSQLEILVLTLPLVFPIILELGFNPVWFGIIVTKTVEIGLVTPPVGMNVFVMAATADGLTPEDGFKGVVPFFAADLLTLLLLILVPELVLLIPNSAA